MTNNTAIDLWLPSDSGEIRMKCFAWYTEHEFQERVSNTTGHCRYRPRRQNRQLRQRSPRSQCEYKCGYRCTSVRICWHSCSYWVYRIARVCRNCCVFCDLSSTGSYTQVTRFLLSQRTTNRHSSTIFNDLYEQLCSTRSDRRLGFW